MPYSSSVADLLPNDGSFLPAMGSCIAFFVCVPLELLSTITDGEPLMAPSTMSSYSIAQLDLSISCLHAVIHLCILGVLLMLNFGADGQYFFVDSP